MRILFVGVWNLLIFYCNHYLNHKKEIVGVITKKEAGLNAD